MKISGWPRLVLWAVCVTSVAMFSAVSLAQPAEGEAQQEVPLPPAGDAVDQYRYAIECYLLALAILNDETPMLGGRMNEPQLKSELYSKLFGAYDRLGQECRKRDDLFNAAAVYADAINRFPSPLVPKPPETAEGGTEAGAEGETAQGAMAVPAGPPEYWVDIPNDLRMQMREHLRVLHNGLCEVLVDLRLSPLAYQQAEYALVMDSAYDLALGNAARLGIILGYLEDGRTYAQWLKDISPRSARAQCDLALANRRLGRNREAIFHYLECLRIDPDDEDGPGKNLHPHVVAHNGLGVIYLQEKNLVEAERELDRAIAKSEELLQYIAHQPRGMAWQRRHEREAFTSAILSYTNQALVYRQLGRLEEATRACRRAVEIGEWLVGRGIEEDVRTDRRIEEWNARLEAQSGAAAGEGRESGGGGGGGTAGGSTNVEIVTGIMSSVTSAAAAGAEGEEGGGGGGGFGVSEEGGEGAEGTAEAEVPEIQNCEMEAREVASIPLATAGLCYRDRAVKEMPKRHGSYDPGGSVRLLHIAADYLERAVSNDPDNSEAWNNLGEVYMQLGRWRDASTAFSFAVLYGATREPHQLERYQANLEAAQRRLGIR